MSVIKDVRKVLEDFIAPELKSLAARLNALEGQVTDLKTEVRASFVDLRTEMRAGLADKKAALARLENQIGLANEWTLSTNT